MPIRPALAALLLALAALLPVHVARAAPAAGTPAPAGAAVPAPRPKAEERWYILQMQDQPAGYARSAVTEADGRTTSVSELRLSFKRGAIGLEIAMDSTFVESAAGEPVSFSVVQKFGAMATERRGTFGRGGVKIVTTQNGQSLEDEQPLPDGEWFPPAAAEREVARQLALGEKSITIRTLDVSVGLRPVTITRAVLGEAEAEVYGRTVPAVRWRTSIDIYPDVQSEELVDAQGRTLRTQTDLGGIRLVQILADRELAKAKVNPPELLVATLVKPDRAIPNPRAVQRGVYTLRVKKGPFPELPASSIQAVERLGPGAARVTVDLQALPPDTRPPVPADSAASSMANTADPEITALLAKLLGERAGAAPESTAATAETLRRGVHGYVRRKDMSVGFATAGEVARTRAGDCTEHAVLLCALLRARGIPARVASGLVFVGEAEGVADVFGYHMWTQAWLPGPGGAPRWVDLDPTLPGAAMDATHILLGTSALSDQDTQNFLVTLAPLLGQLAIEVGEIK